MKRNISLFIVEKCFLIEITEGYKGIGDIGMLV